MTSPHQPYGGQQQPPWSPPPSSGQYQYPAPTTGPSEYPAPQSGPYQYPPPYPQQPGHVPQQRGYGPPPIAPKPKPKWPWIVGVVALLVIVVAAVASRGHGSTTPTAGPLTAGTLDAPAAAADPGAGSGSGVVTWGQRATTDSGLAIEVAKPEPYKASKSAAGNDRERAVKVTTTVFNGSSKPYELNSFIIGPTATHDGKPAPDVFDFGGGADIVPVTTILPGKSFSYTAVFSIGATEADLQLEYEPELFEDPVIVVGRI